MKRFFSIILVLILALCLAGPATAEIRDMWASVYRLTGYDADGSAQLTRITSGVTFQVLRADSDTIEALYVRGTLTSLTNPVTTTNFASATVCNDDVTFSVDPTDAGDEDVDLIVVDTAGGFTAFVEDFNRYDHTIVIDERPNIQHHGVIWYGVSDATEVDTGIDFLADTLVQHVQIEAVTVDATEVYDVGLLSTGTNGDADGFVDGASVATAGFPLVTLTTSGALMDDGTNFDPDGHVVTGANEGSLTYTGSAATDTAVGYIHYFFVRMR